MKRFFNRDPKIGKTVSTLLGAVEVPILEAIRYNNKLNSKYYLKKMDFFSKVYGSKIIPLDISLHGVNRIASTEEILNIIKQIPSLSIGYCYCRATRKKCDNELWTCIHVGNAKNIREIGEKSITRNSTVKEVEKILSKANERGLIHQLITAPTSEYFYVICSCCPCCCVMLQTVLLQHSHRKTKILL
ncbi:hypothetical protein [Candidatus Hodarchaeum mangrovi]